MPNVAHNARYRAGGHAEEPSIYLSLQKKVSWFGGVFSRCLFRGCLRRIYKFRYVRPLNAQQHLKSLPQCCAQTLRKPPTGTYRNIPPIPLRRCTLLLGNKGGFDRSALVPGVQSTHTLLPKPDMVPESNRQTAASHCARRTAQTRKQTNSRPRLVFVANTHQQLMDPTRDVNALDTAMQAQHMTYSTPPRIDHKQTLTYLHNSTTTPSTQTQPPSMQAQWRWYCCYCRT